MTKASRGGGNRGQCLCVRGGKIGKIIFNAHPYHPVAFRWILPGAVWLDRKAGVVLGGGKLCLSTKHGCVGGFGEERMYLVQISC